MPISHFQYMWDRLLTILDFFYNNGDSSQEGCVQGDKKRYIAICRKGSLSKVSNLRSHYSKHVKYNLKFLEVDGTKNQAKAPSFLTTNNSCTPEPIPTRKGIRSVPSLRFALLQRIFIPVTANL